MIYGTYLGPIFRFLNNYIPDDSTNGDPVLSPGDNVIDLSDYYNSLSPTPAATTPSTTPSNNHSQDPNVTPNPTKVPDPTTPVIYVPDPKVPGVKHITGKSLKLEADAVNILLLGVDEKYNNVDSILLQALARVRKL